MKTDRLRPVELSMMMSGLPSPFRSATAMANGRLPAPSVFAGANVGVVAPAAGVFNRTDIVPAYRLATARSGLPSPLQSPAATATGPSSLLKPVGELKPARSTENVRSG